jgi:hypothetical protein
LLTRWGRAAGEQTVGMGEDGIEEVEYGTMEEEREGEDGGWK